MTHVVVRGRDGLCHLTTPVALKAFNNENVLATAERELCFTQSLLGDEVCREQL
jgi:hypothetical protein